jgi:hypothetical protein
MKERRGVCQKGVGEIYVPERSVEEERLLKRHDVKNEVSREDTKGSSSRVVEKEVRSPWIIRDVVESMEDEVQSSSTNDAEDSDEGALPESEEILVVIRRLTWLNIGSSFGFTNEEDEVAWSNPLFEPPPHAF